MSRKGDPNMAARTWKGSEALKALLVPLKDLKLDPRNARRHSERNIEAIRQSLERFGQTKPVVTREGTVFAGEGTLRAADILGWTHLAVASAEHLTEEEAHAYGIADNRTAEMAEWDYDRVSALIEDLPDDLKGMAGFEDFQTPNFVASGADTQSTLDSKAKVECPECGHAFTP